MRVSTKDEWVEIVSGLGPRRSINNRDEVLDMPMSCQVDDKALKERQRMRNQSISLGS